MIGMKGYFTLVFVVALILGAITYWNFQQYKIDGSSENGVWKAEYIEEKIGGSSIGWTANVNQKNDKKLTVRKLELIKNGKVIVEQTKFKEFKDINGKNYTLHPFSYPALYGGNAPEKDDSYHVRIIWEDKRNKEHTDDIELK